MTEELDEMLDGLSADNLAALMEVEVEEPESAFQLRLKREKNESQEEAHARHLLRPEITAAVATRNVINKVDIAEGVDINCLLDELSRQTEFIRKKDLSRGEAMLATQAHTLDQLFSRLIAQGIANVGSYPEFAATYLKLAFKAQSQCRSTWEAVSKIQNPPVTNHVVQQNVVHSQQVNNAPNQISGEENELLPDKSDEGAPIPLNSPVETVGAHGRAKDRRRQA